MNSLILKMTTRLIMGLLLVFSVFLLLRGHNLPGGGFTGGLVAASAFALQALAVGTREARATLILDPRTIIGLGLAISLASGFPSVLAGQTFMTGIWDKTVLPVVGKIGTPLVFDVGVYFVVLGVVLLFVLSFANNSDTEARKESQWN